MPLDIALEDKLLSAAPERTVSVREAFGVDSDMQVPAFGAGDPHVPELDRSYRFDPQTTNTPPAGRTSCS